MTTTQHPPAASGLNYNPYAPRNVWNRAMNLLAALFSLMAVLPLVALTDVGEAGLWERIKDEISLWFE